MPQILSGRVSDKGGSIYKLLIVSHVLHYQYEGQLYAYGPYAREIDIWADLFPQVIIAAPCREAPPPGDAVAFTRSNISIAPQPESGGDALLAKAAQVAELPVLKAGGCAVEAY